MFRKRREIHIPDALPLRDELMRALGITMLGAELTPNGEHVVYTMCDDDGRPSRVAARVKPLIDIADLAGVEFGTEYDHEWNSDNW